MKPNHPKLKTQLFSCGFFRQCTQTVLSPTTSTPPPLPQPPPQPPVSSSSSSSNTSQSFTQWRFPISRPRPESGNPKTDDVPPTVTNASLDEVFHAAELQFGAGSETARLGAVHLLEQSLVPNRHSAVDGCPCPTVVLAGVVLCLREGVARKPASKVLLALCLVEANRSPAVEVGAVTAVVEALTDAESVVAERSLAALELLCTTVEGAEEVRAHALAVPMMVQVMGRMEGRGKEHAMSVLAVIYGGLDEGAVVAPAEEVARAVVLALQGDCSARGRRKGAQLLKILHESGRVDVNEDDR